MKIIIEPGKPPIYVDKKGKQHIHINKLSYTYQTSNSKSIGTNHFEVKYGKTKHGITYWLYKGWSLINE